MKNQKLRLIFEGIPKAVQSVRFAKIGNFVKSYQPKEVVQWQNYLKILTKHQLPEGFKIFDGLPLFVRMDFIYTVPKSYKKAMHEQVKRGELVYKITRPDVTDNLAKGLIDALTGIVWQDDSIIAESNPRKFYGLKNMTIIEVFPIPEGVEVVARIKQADENKSKIVDIKACPHTREML